MEFIHWVDGMKVNKDHFIGLENSFFELTRINSSFIDHNTFGLLVSEIREIKSIAKIEEDKVIVSACKGFTASGGYFELIEEEVVVNMEEVGAFYLFLKVDFNKRKGIGKIAKGEPLREEKAHFKCNLELGKKLLFVPNGIPVCKIIVSDRIIIDENFIPPVMFLGENFELVNSDKFQFWNFIERTWKECLNLQVKCDSVLSVGITVESRFICEICKAILRYLGQKIEEYKLKGSRFSPKDFFMFHSSLNHVVTTAIQSFSEISLIKISSHSRLLREQIEFFKNQDFNWKIYNHLDMEKNITLGRDLLMTVSKLLNNLNEINLKPSRKTGTTYD